MKGPVCILDGGRIFTANYAERREVEALVKATALLREMRAKVKETEALVDELQRKTETTIWVVS